MKNVIIFLSFLFISVYNLHAQATTESIHLCNGQVVQGNIIEIQPYISIKMQTIDGSVVTYKMDEIERISYKSDKNILPAITVDHNHEHDTKYSKKSLWKIETGHTFGLGYWAEGKFNVYASYAHQFNPYFSLGAGTGLNYFYESAEVDMPFYLNASTNFFKKTKSPYMDVKIGFTTIVDIDVFFSTAFGYRFTNKRQRIMNVGLEYNYHYCHGLGLTYGILF